MSTQSKTITFLSIAAVVMIGVLAYGIRYGFTAPFIVLPEESMQMHLVPIRVEPVVNRS